MATFDAALSSATFTYDLLVGSEDFDLPKTEQPVWVIGNEYSALYDRNEIKEDILTRFWFSYRKGFAPIGGTGPVTDAHWGCMLRCGQMIMSEAMSRLHLGRKWRWKVDCKDPAYWKIISMFQDQKGCLFSIHQIAMMGVTEGKEIGKWFGPNTVAQVLRKLAIYDEWSRLVVHVAMDNTVIVDDINLLCRRAKREVPCEQIESSSSSILRGSPPGVERKDSVVVDHSNWRPLVLFIPLRLGLQDINTVYIRSLKACLEMPQSLGIIGGSSNQAHFFIGYFDDWLLYLDPHTTQPVVDFSQPGANDASYHCSCHGRMKFTSLDPSIALGFYCANEEDFHRLLNTIQERIVAPEKRPMFEVYQSRPKHWPPFQPYTGEGTNSDFTFVDEERRYDSDEEFELLG